MIESFDEYSSHEGMTNAQKLAWLEAELRGEELDRLHDERCDNAAFDAMQDKRRSEDDTL